SISNIKEIRVEPSELRELISLSPEIVPSDCSSGVAALDAMVSGLAPAMLADTEIMGKSTCGKGATGRKTQASPPDNTMSRQSSVAATGRMMKAASSLMERLHHRRAGCCDTLGYAAPACRPSGIESAR